MNKDNQIFENIIIYLGIYFLCSLLIAGILIVFMGNIDFNIMTLLSSILTIVCLFLLFKNRNISLYRYCSFKKMKFSELILLIFMGLIFNMVLEIMNITLKLYKYFPDYYKYQDFYNKIGNYKVNFLTVFLSVVIIAPIVEEIIFRGLIFNELRKELSIYTAIIIQSAIFAIIHGSLYQGFYAFLLGIFLSVMYYLTESIWAPIIIHISSNLIGLLGGLFDNIIHNMNKIESTFYFFLGCILLIITIKFFYSQRKKCYM
ncbi:hypothetical protein EDC21_11115 [Thermohydrogenium kirishiense]|nr:hypothetical protein EDC21_11115 [Thermohydrogenium kirishiense]